MASNMYKIIVLLFFSGFLLGCEVSKEQKNKSNDFDQEVINSFSARTYINLDFYYMNFGKVPANGVTLDKFLAANNYIQEEDSIYKRFLGNLEIRRWKDEIYRVYLNEGESRVIDTVDFLSVCGLNENVFSVTTDLKITTDSIDWVKDSLKEFIIELTKPDQTEYSHILIEIDKTNCDYQLICSSAEVIDHESLNRAVKKHFTKYNKLEIPISILLPIRI